MTKLKDDGGDDKYIIGEATPVRIGLIIAFLGFFATGIYWCSSINSKLDSILAYQTMAQNTFTELKAKDVSLDKDISEIKLQIALLQVSIKSIQDKVSENASKIQQNK